MEPTKKKLRWFEHRHSRQTNGLVQKLKHAEIVEDKKWRGRFKMMWRRSEKGLEVPSHFKEVALSQ